MKAFDWRKGKEVPINEYLRDNILTSSFFPRAFNYLIRRILSKYDLLLHKIYWTKINFMYKFSKENFNKKKYQVMLVWDFNKQSGTMGDCVFAIMNSVLITENYDLNKKIEVAFIDEKKKSKIGGKSKKWKEMIIKTTVVTNRIQRIKKFREYSSFNKYRQKKNYIYWPSPKSRGCPYISNYIMDFYNEHKYLPEFRVQEKYITSVKKLILKEHPKKPIVVNIRNLNRGINQNTNIKEMKKFLKYYENSEEFFFIIICSKEEISSEVKDLKNVYFSKEYYESIEYDYALINSAYLCIFPNTGAAFIGYFSKVPLILYGYNIPKSSIWNLKDGETFPFLNQYQRMFWHTLEAKWLKKEFEKLVRDIEQK